MPLSEHMYCVAKPFKMPEWIEQQVCIRFCVKLENSSTETIWLIQKVTAMGSWWLAASSQQRTHSCVMCCTEFFGKTSNHPGDSAPYSPDLVPCSFWLFPKMKSPLKGKRFQIIEIQENTMGQLTATGKTVWGPKVPALKRTEASLSCVQCFSYLVSSSINVSTFHRTWLDTFWTDLKCSEIRAQIKMWLLTSLLPDAQETREDREPM